MIAAQIETRKGLEKVREIASVEGLDMLFFGPGDFSVSTGVAMNDASVFSASKQVSEVAFNSQRLFGTFVMRKEDIASAKQAGAKLVVCASDTLFLSNSMKIDDGD
jgi:4-hydroxy-2-oxoheptanedioate aldolase